MGPFDTQVFGATPKSPFYFVGRLMQTLDDYKLSYIKVMNKRLNVHQFDEKKKEISENIRQKCKDLSTILINDLPCSMELSESLKKLDQLLMYSNAALARHDLDK